ncbi:MAG: penicillin acylase family protein, partial [Balneolales bacterium]
IYEIEFQSESKEKYLHDGEWKQAYSEIEEIKVRDGESVLDTIIYTHHGPITLKEGEEPFQDFTPPEHAIRWLAHDESNEILTFLKINRARNYQEFVDGIKHHEVPAQTYAYADVGGNIALWSNGLFPLKWHGQGDFINDGRDPLYDWQGWIPHEQNPHHENPASGYVGSANQPQVGPDYPYYLGRHFSPNERAIRLDELLNEASGIDKEYMRQMQNDNLNVHARTILPFLLERIDKGSLDNHQQEIISELNVWDYKMDPESRSATVFHFWWRELYRSMWETLYGNQENVLKYPARDHTVYLMISEPDSELFTHESNGYTLSLNDFIKDSFVYVEGDLVQEHGEFGDSWNWGQAQGANIGHVASIPGFDSGHLLTGGDDGVLNAVRRGDNGPSWRMVVDLDQTVQGYGIYPGGQSGNPGSKHYDQFVDDWVEGELYELLFLESPDEKHPSIRYSLTMTTN